MKGRHIHIVSFDVPYPPSYGGVIDVYYKALALHNLGVKIILHCFEYKGRPAARELEDICEKVYYYPRKVSKGYLFSPKPYIVVTRTSETLMANLLKDNHPILFEGLHCTYYLDDKRLKKRFKIVRTHNIEHDYYENLAKVEKNMFKRIYFFSEAGKLRDFEKVLKHADLIAAISPNDAANLAKRYKHVHNVTAFHPNNNLTAEQGKGNFALYHGSLDVSENNEAALFLVEKVFNNTKVPLVIAGNKPSKELREAVATHSNVKLASENITTEEIHHLIRTAHINVLPTFQATGIKLKLLAALFNGRFCVANTPMVENTGLEQLCTVADNAADMRKAIEQLMKKEYNGVDTAMREEKLLHAFSNQENAKKLIGLIRWE